MNLTWPYVDENWQVIFVKFENETIHDVVNGALLGIVVFGPLALLGGGL